MSETSDQYEARGRALLQQNRPSEGLDVFNEGLRRFPQDAELLLGKGWALIDLKAPAEAEEILQTLVLRLPEHGDSLQALAAARLALGKKEGAVAAVRQACRDHEKNPDFIHALGRMLFRHGLYAEAEECYRKALRLDSAHPHAWLGVAASLHRRGRRDDAIVVLRNAVYDRLPGFAEGYSYLGCLLFDAGRREEAERILKQIPLDELRDPAAVKRLRAFLAADDDPARDKVLRVIEERAAAALRTKPHKPRKPREKRWRGFFIVGPVNGDLAGLQRILHHAGLTTARGKWRGENAQLVLIGPFGGRGGAAGKVADFVQKLIRQAGELGKGMIHVVLAAAETPIAGIPEQWAARTEDYLVTSGGVLPDTLDRLLRPPTTSTGYGPYRKPVLLSLTERLRPEDLGNPVPDALLARGETRVRQILTHDGPAGAYGLDEPFVRLNSGLGQEERGLRYLQCLGQGGSPRLHIVLNGPPEPLRVNWIVTDQLGGGHGVYFMHEAAGHEIIAYADGYHRGAGRVLDEIAVHLLRTEPEGFKTAWLTERLDAPARPSWEAIIAEVREAVGHYFKSNEHFAKRGKVKVMLGA